jgi:hypothetical protein
MMLSADDMEGVDVDLSTVRAHVVTLILGSLPFFRDLTPFQRENLSGIMEMGYHAKGHVIFEEGDAGCVPLDWSLLARLASPCPSCPSCPVTNL